MIDDKHGRQARRRRRAGRRCSPQEEGANKIKAIGDRLGGPVQRGRGVGHAATGTSSNDPIATTMKTSQHKDRRAKQQAKLAAAQSITDFRPVEQLPRQKHLPAGVYVHHATSDSKELKPNEFHPSRAVVAGYHGFGTTKKLERFMAKDACLPHLLQCHHA